MNTDHDACSLPSGGQIKRLKTIRGELSQASSQYKASGSRRYTFAPDADRRARLDALVAAEKACCSFLQIDLQVGDEIVLSIAGPESFLGQLETNQAKAPWVAIAGVVAMATCALPLALGAAAVWIEGGGFVLLLVAAAMLGWRFWKNRGASRALNTQTD